MGISLSKAFDSNDSYFNVTNTFLDEKGINYTGLSSLWGNKCNHSTWKDKFITEAINNCINDFNSYSFIHDKT
jgi:hypothetical protein